MRILLISKFGQESSGVWCATVGPSMAKMGHEVTLLVLARDQVISKQLSGTGVKVINYPLVAEIYEGFFFSPLAIPKVMFPNYDIIHAHHVANWGSILSAIRHHLRGTPHFVTVHTGLRKSSKYMRHIYRVPAHFVLNATSSVLLLSSFHRELLIREDILPKAAPFLITHNPVSKDLFAIPRTGRSVSCGIYVGRMETYQKALDRLLPVFAALRESNIRFLMVGDGPFRQTLKQHIRDNGWKHVELVGHVPNEQLHSVLEKADFFIMSSKYETQPIALLEAMASGLPAVASDIPGITEFCPEDAGFFIHNPDNPVEWTDAIRHLLNNPETAYEMGQNARQAAMPHHPDKVAAEHLEIYRKFVKNQNYG